MRKDVRLGLAVGVILVGVVLVYALFFAGGHNDGTRTGINKNTNSDGGKIDKAGPQAREYPIGSSDPADKGNGDKGVAAAKDDKNTSASQRNDGTEIAAKDKPVVPNPVGGSPAVGSENANDLASVKDFRWDVALKGGAAAALVARSETPSPTAPDHGTALSDPSHVSKLANSPQGTHTYVVKQGDTFWTIAQAEYGDGTYYSHLMRANPNITPNRLRAGVSIKVPGKGEVVPASAAARLAQAGPTTRPIDARQEYRVGPGESLYAIAKKLYGKTDKVNQIYEMNKDLIGPNPAALKRGMVLRLPEPPSVATAQ